MLTYTITYKVHHWESGWRKLHWVMAKITLQHSGQGKSDDIPD